MPIRSDHGRHAALRSLATWPLYSPRRFAALLCGVAALSTGATIIIAATNPNPGQPAPPSPTRVSSASPTQPTRWSATARTTSQGAPHEEGVGAPTAAAQRFAATWVARKPSDAWRSALAPLCTEEFRATALAVMSPDSVTATAVSGQAKVTHQAQRSADVTIPLNTTDLKLTLQDVTGNGDWRVADVQPAR
jgi:hypothetical protein